MISRLLVFAIAAVGCAFARDLSQVYDVSFFEESHGDTPENEAGIETLDIHQNHPAILANLDDNLVPVLMNTVAAEWVDSSRSTLAANDAPKATSSTPLQAGASPQAKNLLPKKFVPKPQGLPKQGGLPKQQQQLQKINPKKSHLKTPQGGSPPKGIPGGLRTTPVKRVIPKGSPATGGSKGVVAAAAQPPWPQPKTLLSAQGAAPPMAGGAAMATSLADASVEALLDVTPEWDYIVGGFPKCGTTTLLKAFAAHPETDMADSEQCAIASPGQADALVLKKLDESLKAMPSFGTRDNDNMKVAFKCPTAIYNYKSIIRMEKHSPNGKFIVGIRNPVSMMNSFYNYRVTEIYERGLYGTEEIPDFLELMASSNPWKGVSMQAVRFELFLQQLGKTHLTPDEFNEMSSALGSGYELAVKPSNFKIFLYTVDQLEDSDEERSGRLLSELTSFLDLTTEISPFGHENKNHATGSSGHPETISICDDKYAEVRSMLVKNGITTAAWLRDHFLQSPDVIVANPEHFVETLEGWSIDPCTAKVTVEKSSEGTQAAE